MVSATHGYTPATHLGKPRMRIAGQREGGREGEVRTGVGAVSVPVVPTLFQLVRLLMGLLKTVNTHPESWTYTQHVHRVYTGSD